MFSTILLASLLVVGDSMAVYWPTEAKVAQGGAQAEQLLYLASDTVRQTEADTVVLWLGTAHLYTDASIDSLLRAIELLKRDAQHAGAEVWIIAPAPRVYSFDPLDLEAKALQTRYMQRRIAVAVILRERYAGQAGVYVYDPAPLVASWPAGRTVKIDGVHWNAAGYAVLEAIIASPLDGVGHERPGRLSEVDRAR